MRVKIFVATEKKSCYTECHEENKDFFDNFDCYNFFLVINLKIKYVLFVTIALAFIVNCAIGQSVSSQEKNMENVKLLIEVNGTLLKATLVDNSSTRALVDFLKDQKKTIIMHDYGNFEKVGNLDILLPKNDKNISTTAGDLILYQGNKFVIYYDTNSWNFTKLGKIDSISVQTLKNILGKDDVSVTLSIEYNKN